MFLCECQTLDESHEMPGFIYSEKQNRKFAKWSCAVFVTGAIRLYRLSGKFFIKKHLQKLIHWILLYRGTENLLSQGWQNRFIHHWKDFMTQVKNNEILLYSHFWGNITLHSNGIL